MKKWISTISLGLVLGLGLPAVTAAQPHTVTRQPPPSSTQSDDAQSTPLPDVVVHGSPWERQFGGYIRSSNFAVNPKLPYMVYPASALEHRDVLSIHPLILQDNEYLVLQECVTPSCNEAKIIRLWNTNGVMAQSNRDTSEVIIPHKARYFIWLKRLPEAAFNPTCETCDTHFDSFHLISPPLTLIPNGQLAAYYQDELGQAAREPPVKVVSEKHEGSVYVVTFASGSQVRMQRLRPEHDN